MGAASEFVQIDRAMDAAAAEGVFPGGVLLWARGEDVLYHRGAGTLDYDHKQPVQKDTVYDLASLTKPLATALAVADLIKKQQVFPDSSLKEILPETRDGSLADVTVDMLLRHTSGLPAHREYFRQIRGRAGARNSLRQMIVREPLEAAPGSRECYSDIGYMMLSWVVERLSGCNLDLYVTEHVYTPLGLCRLGFAPLDQAVPDWLRGAAPTMDCPWRRKVMRAQVEDENAWAAGGVEGHAGLFGTASTVHRLCSEIMKTLSGTGSGILDPQVLQSFVRPVGGRGRVAGFDRPSGKMSAAGRHASATVIGHLGFTGTSFWMDPASGLIVVLLSNRVHPSRENLKIRKFRPLIHDLVFKAFERIIPL